MRIGQKNNNFNFKSNDPFSKPLGQFYDKNATLPTLLIESGVTLGRTYEANKALGKKAAVERFVEQGASAIIWVYGVQFLQKTVETLARPFLKGADLNFDVGFDALRNPIKNNKIDPKIANFKTLNMIATTAFATYFIGFILPKINYKISSHFSNKNDSKEKKEIPLKAPSFEEFQKNTNKNKKKENLSFKSKLDTFAHILENNSTARLFITDLGVVSGRFKNARNKKEKIGGLFRDISSIYFYLRATKDIVKVLNKSPFSKSTNIDPKAQEAVLGLIEEKIKNGATKEDIIKNLSQELDIVDKKNIDLIFANQKNGTIKTEDFINYYAHLKDKALDMAKLQPIFEGSGVLSKQEAYDVLNPSWVAEPRFLKETMAKITKGKSDDKRRYVSKDFLEKQRKSLSDFSDKIVEFLKKENIEEKDLSSKLQSFAKKNTRNNFINYAIATILSSFALGIIIPKVQYFIMEKFAQKENDKNNRK